MISFNVLTIIAAASFGKVSRYLDFWTGLDDTMTRALPGMRVITRNLQSVEKGEAIEISTRISI